MGVSRSSGASAPMISASGTGPNFPASFDQDRGIRQGCYDVLRRNAIVGGQYRDLACEYGRAATQLLDPIRRDSKLAPGDELEAPGVKPIVAGRNHARDRAVGSIRNIEAGQIDRLSALVAVARHFVARPSRRAMMRSMRMRPSACAGCRVDGSTISRGSAGTSSCVVQISASGPR